MEFFPKAIAIGNLKRRLVYWVRSLSSESRLWKPIVGETFSINDGAFSVAASISREQRFSQRSSCLLRLLEDGKAIQEIISKSVLLRERTSAEAKLFTNNQFLAQTMKEDAKQIQRDLQGFLVIRNKLVHRAKIDHPLLPVVSQRAKARLYDLLRDISGQLLRPRG